MEIKQIIIILDVMIIQERLYIVFVEVHLFCVPAVCLISTVSLIFAVSLFVLLVILILGRLQSILGQTFLHKHIQNLLVGIRKVTVIKQMIQIEILQIPFILDMIVIQERLYVRCTILLFASVHIPVSFYVLFTIILLYPDISQSIDAISSSCRSSPPPSESTQTLL